MQHGEDDEQRAGASTSPGRRNGVDSTAPTPDQQAQAHDEHPDDGEASSHDRSEVARVASEVETAEQVLEGELQPPASRQRRHLKWSGPLPPPNDLAAYERVIPGLADRVVRLTERNADLAEQRARTVDSAVRGQVEIQQTLADGQRSTR